MHNFSLSSLILNEFKEALRAAKHIVVVAGAGLSAASGIPTFRGAGGLWRKYNAMELATPEAFKKDPALVWQFYHYRRHVAHRAQPNAAHRAIALLCASQAELRRVAPAAESFVLVTQNVDNLSNKALPPDTPEESRPIEMHGNIFRVQCTECNYVGFNYDDPICPALGGTEAVFERDAPEFSIDVKDLPRCPDCGALARPGVVWFGESISLIDDIEEIIETLCDLILVVGTSSTVHPAALFAETASSMGAKVALFNVEETLESTVHFKFIGPAEELLPRALGVEDRVKL